jgi:putative ABC transport system permease protein
MTTTLVRLLAVERGFEAEGLLAINYAIPRGGSDDVALNMRQEAILARVAAEPRVESVSLSCIAPLSGWCIKGGLRSDDVPASEESPAEAGIHMVGADFFAALGTDILAGRSFMASDNASALPVAILNRSAALALFGAADPIGHTVRMPELGRATIVGVAQDLIHASRIEEGAKAEVYVPFAQSTISNATLLVRGTGDPGELGAAVERSLKEQEPGITVSSRITGDELLARATVDRRALLWLLGVFAVSSMTLAALGIWSIVAYSIGQRTQELGVRAALGAGGFELVGLVARGGLIAATCGILPGAAVAYFGSGVLSTLVYGVAPTDPWIYLMAGAGFLAVALVASGIPALRAARLDPVKAMRVE